LPVVGFIDLGQRLKDDSVAIRDLKTAGKSPSKSAADRSDQLTIYSLAYRSLPETTEPERLLTLDTLVALKKPKVDVKETTRTADDHVAALRDMKSKMETVLGWVKEGREDWPGCNKELSWWCDDKWCGYYSTCPYISKKEQGI
jgi:RecB family exonuclease